MLLVSHVTQNAHSKPSKNMEWTNTEFSMGNLLCLHFLGNIQNNEVAVHIPRLWCSGDVMPRSLVVSCQRFGGTLCFPFYWQWVSTLYYKMLVCTHRLHGMAMPVQLISSGGAAPTHYVYLAQLRTVTALIPALLTFSNLFITRKSFGLMICSKCGHPH